MRSSSQPWLVCSGVGRFLMGFRSLCRSVVANSWPFPPQSEFQREFAGVWAGQQAGQYCWCVACRNQNLSYSSFWLDFDIIFHVLRYSIAIIEQCIMHKSGPSTIYYLCATKSHVTERPSDGQEGCSLAVSSLQQRAILLVLLGVDTRI